jgi:ATP-dependent Clp protease ATP-binding subunit ClpX
VRAGQRTKADLACSFCGKSGEQVEVLVAPPDDRVHICDECVDFCNEIIAERRSKPEPQR